jgi:hypothetical protein
MDIRNSKQNASSLLLTPLFQQLGRLARYTKGESPFKSPIALLGSSVYHKFRAGLEKWTNLAEIIKSVCNSNCRLVSAFHGRILL